MGWETEVSELTAVFRYTQPS